MMDQNYKHSKNVGYIEPKAQEPAAIRKVDIAFDCTNNLVERLKKVAYALECPPPSDCCSGAKAVPQPGIIPEMVDRAEEVISNVAEGTHALIRIERLFGI